MEYLTTQEHISEGCLRVKSVLHLVMTNEPRSRLIVPHLQYFHSTLPSVLTSLKAIIVHGSGLAVDSRLEHGSYIVSVRLTSHTIGAVTVRIITQAPLEAAVRR